MSKKGSTKSSVSGAQTHKQQGKNQAYTDKLMMTVAVLVLIAIVGLIGYGADRSREIDDRRYDVVSNGEPESKQTEHNDNLSDDGKFIESELFIVFAPEVSPTRIAQLINEINGQIVERYDALSAEGSGQFYLIAINQKFGDSASISAYVQQLLANYEEIIAASPNHVMHLID